MNLQWFCNFQKQLHFQLYKIKLGWDEKILSLLSRQHKVFCELVIPFSHLLSTWYETEGRLELLGLLKARFRVVFLLLPGTEKSSYHFIENHKAAPMLSALSMCLRKLTGKDSNEFCQKKILPQSYAVKEKQCFEAFIKEVLKFL